MLEQPPTRPRALPKPLLPLWVAVITSAVSGLLMDLAYPAAALWVLAFPSIALLLVSLVGRTAWGALLVGLVHGLVFYGALVSWTSRYLGWLPWAALTALEATLTAVGLLAITLAYRWVPRAIPGTVGRLVVVPLVVAALWVARELLIGSWPYGGFPWARAGMTQSESPFASVTSWVGVSGLGFLMVLVTAATVEWVRIRERRHPVAAAWPAALVIAMLAIPIFPTTPAGSLRIGAVQGNGPTGYFDSREPFAVVEAQSAASETLIGAGAQLVVWPEGGLDADPQANELIARRLTYLSWRLDAPLLVNAAAERDGLYYNTTMLWQGDEVVQTHAKRHPVPFGEYVPNRPFFNALVPDLIGLIQREYTPGNDAPIVIVDDVPIGLAICFDVIYDDVIREGIGHGAQVLVFQTNNADFRGTDENLQQLAFARMRAIETGRSVVNISTVGTSQIIRPNGSTAATVPADEAGVLIDDVELRTGLTPAMVVSPVLEPVLLWAGPAALLISGLAVRRQRQAPILPCSS